MTTPLLSLRGVGLDYMRGGVRLAAVDAVDLDIAEGDRIAVMGPSGAGKSTLARMMVGLLKPERGDIAFRGQSIVSLSARSLRSLRLQVQIVFQDSWGALEPRWNARTSIEAPLRIHGRPRRGVAERLAALVHLPESRLVRRPHELSGGERQRVALARALALEPKVLVLDEPLMGLDPIAAKGLRRRLVSLQHELQLTSVWITHAPGEAMAVSDRMVVMNEGRIVERGPVPRVLGDPQHGTTQALADARARIVSLLNDPS